MQSFWQVKLVRLDFSQQFNCLQNFQRQFAETLPEKQQPYRHSEFIRLKKFNQTWLDPVAAN